MKNWLPFKTKYPAYTRKISWKYGNIRKNISPICFLLYSSHPLIFITSFAFPLLVLPAVSQFNISNSLNRFSFKTSLNHRAFFIEPPNKSLINDTPRKKRQISHLVGMRPHFKVFLIGHSFYLVSGTGQTLLRI